MFFSIIFIILIVFADQISKWLAVIFLEGAQPVYLIPSVLRLTYVENRGAAFGMLDDQRWIFLVITTVTIVGLFVFLAKAKPQSRLGRAGITLVIGGGIGNMIDRLMLGYVIDFIDFCAFPNLWKWVFNIADACVCVGAALLALWLILDTVADYKAQKQEKTGEEKNDADHS
jgi:signal peptidase II